MRILLVIVLGLSLVYLLAWPTDVAPKAWEAPVDAGFTGVHSANERLASMTTIPVTPFGGPETLALDANGALLTGVETGELLRIDPTGTTSVIARLGGRPLGVALDAAGAMYVANAGVGLQRVTADGKSRVLARSFAGTRIGYANSVVVAPDGRVYFTDASTHFLPDKHGGTLEASVLDMLEHDPNGRLYRYDPATEELDLVLDQLAFPNGLAVDPEGRFLLLAETGHYRIQKIWLGDGDDTRVETILDNLPGFPDNLSRGQDGRYWVGITAPRKALLDSLDDQPLLRKMLARLPPAFRPRPQRYAHVVAIDANGTVQFDLQSSLGPLYMVTGVVEGDDQLYLATLTGAEIGVLPKLALER